MALCAVVLCFASAHRVERVSILVRHRSLALICVFAITVQRVLHTHDLAQSRFVGACDGMQFNESQLHVLTGVGIVQTRLSLALGKGHAAGRVAAGVYNLSSPHERVPHMPREAHNELKHDAQDLILGHVLGPDNRALQRAHPRTDIEDPQHTRDLGV